MPKKTELKTAAKVADELTSPEAAIEQAAEQNEPEKIVLTERPGDWAQAGNRLYAHPGSTAGEQMTVLQIERVITGEDELPENAPGLLREAVEAEKKARKDLADKRAKLSEQLAVSEEWNLHIDALKHMTQAVTNANNNLYGLEDTIKRLRDRLPSTFGVHSAIQPVQILRELVIAELVLPILRKCVDEQQNIRNSHIHMMRTFGKANQVPENIWPN